jgi:predicted HicB family RNase H-like nuclease
MEESKPLPEFGTTQDLVNYFDTHEMGDHWAQMPEAHFEVSLKKKTYLVSVDEEVMKRLSDIARAQQTSAEALVNSWLREKTAQAV